METQEPNLEPVTPEESQKALLKLLYEKYQNKGSNFHFRAKNYADQIGNSYRVSCCLKRFSNKEIIKLIKHRSRGSLWQTNFQGRSLWELSNEIL